MFINTVLPEDAGTVELRYPLATARLSGGTVDRVRIAESGYSSREEMRQLERIGADGVLIGETLLRAESIEEAFASLFGTVPGERPTGSKSS